MNVRTANILRLDDILADDFIRAVNLILDTGSPSVVLPIYCIGC